MKYSNEYNTKMIRNGQKKVSTHDLFKLVRHIACIGGKKQTESHKSNVST